MQRGCKKGGGGMLLCVVCILVCYCVVVGYEAVIWVRQGRVRRWVAGVFVVIYFNLLC